MPSPINSSSINPHHSSHSSSSTIVSTDTDIHTISTIQRLSDSAIHTMHKLKDLALYHLTPRSLCQKTKNAIKAKVRPFSNPPGWKEKMQKAKDTLVRLRWIKADLEGKFQQGLLKPEEREEASKLLTRAIKAIELNETLIVHYHEERDAQITARLGGLTGNALNLMIPGMELGSLVSNGVTSLMVAKQEESAAGLSIEHPEISQAKQNTRINTLLAAVCGVASIAFSYYVLPTMREAGSTLIENYLKSKS